MDFSITSDVGMIRSIGINHNRGISCYGGVYDWVIVRLDSWVMPERMIVYPSVYRGVLKISFRHGTLEVA